MAKSFIEYHGQGFWMDDYLIETWLILLVDDLKKLDNSDTWTQEIIHSWTIQATYGFTGCVSPELNNILSSPERITVLISLAEKLLDQLKQRKNDFSIEELNSLGVGGEGFKFVGNMSPIILQDVGEQFLKLIRGENDNNDK